MLAKSIATMFAHIGFESKYRFCLYNQCLSRFSLIVDTHLSVLDVLTDVLETFFQTICKKVVEATINEENGEDSGFPVCLVNF